jgi:hypothetical protein
MPRFKLILETETIDGIENSLPALPVWWVPIWRITYWKTPIGNLWLVPLAEPADQYPSPHPRINSKDRVHLVYGDLRDSLSLDQVVREAKPDYVFHLAAQSYPKTSFDAPIDLRHQCRGHRRLLALASPRA